VFNLCADKRAVFGEVRRVLRPGGRLQFAETYVLFFMYVRTKGGHGPLGV
jgi:ubiquinone/menaquinone biosynthesis C-methylase UbiE